MLCKWPLKDWRCPVYITRDVTQEGPVVLFSSRITRSNQFFFLDKLLTLRPITWIYKKNPISCWLCLSLSDLKKWDSVWETLSQYLGPQERRPTHKHVDSGSMKFMYNLYNCDLCFNSCVCVYLCYKYSLVWKTLLSKKQNKTTTNRAIPGLLTYF